MLYGKFVVAGLVMGVVGLAPVKVCALPTGQTIAQSAAQQQVEGKQLVEQGSQQFQTKQYEAAIKSWEQALKIFQQSKDRNGEAVVLANLGIAYRSSLQYEKAIAYFQRVLLIFVQIKDRNSEAKTLNNLGIAYSSLSQYEKAIAYYQKALSIYQQVKNRNSEANVLSNLGIAYRERAQSEQAITYFQQALAIFVQIKDRNSEASMLNNLGTVYLSFSQYEKAIAYFQQALPLYQQVKNRNSEAKALLNLGSAYASLSQSEKAITYFHQALPIFVQIKDRNSEAKALGNLGSAYASLSQYEKAIIYFQQALPIFVQIKDRNSEAIILTNLGSAYDSLSQYEKAIIYHQQALPIFVQVKDRNREAIALTRLGDAYQLLSQYEKAIGYYQQALPVHQQVKNRNSEADTLRNLGSAYVSLSQYEKAIAYFQQALPIFVQIKRRDGEAGVLNNLGNAYRLLFQQEKAITYFQQALPIFVQVKDRTGEAMALGNLGVAYWSLSQYEKALAYFQQALPIFQQTKDRNSEAGILMNLGIVYRSLSQYEKAITYYQQALPIFQQTKDRNSEATALNNLGYAYLPLLQYEKAIAYYQQALPVYQQVKDREGEGRLFSNLGNLFVQRQQPEVAIAFYKQSVNVRQTIRGGIRGLPRESQESYTQSVAGTYRALADLLLSQGRIAEAQQVLELLKLQELRDFSPDTRTGDTPTAIALSQSETSILTAHTSLIAFAQTMQQCYSDSTCASSPRLQTLIAQRDRQNIAFANLVKTLEAQLKQQVATDIAFINPNDPNNDFRRRAEAILNSQPGTLLIYPLVLEDKMWLLVGSPGSVFTRYEVKVGQKELASTVLQFRTEMKRCETTPCTQADTKRVKQVSQTLYQWMFPPQLQKELQAIVKQPIRNLVFAPDRSTRYIPMGALFDGEKYLIERYTVSTIVAASKTDAGARLSTQANVLAMGLSDAVPGFNALPNVPIELDAIVKTKQTQDAQGSFPGNKFLNQAFTKPKLQTELPRHQILHLATHAKFEPGAGDRSFLVLGDGYRFKSPDIQGLNGLPGVHLVVLSACETALGGRREQDGIEIAGINNAFLERGAKSVIASLWQVNDPSTSLWMQQFYQNLARGNLTKSQAIQNVQVNFLSGKITPNELQGFRAGARRFVEGGGQVDFTHPYYWAPFILIGNAL